MYRLLEALLVLALLGLAGWYLVRRLIRSKRAVEKGSGCGCGSCDSCPTSQNGQTDREP